MDKFPKLKSYAGKIIFHLIKRKSIGKRQDEIAEIGIDEKHQLYIKPKKEKFSLIYRTATEVHWDMEKLFLYSPEPREWDYCTWYEHIVRVVDTECNCSLVLTNRTIWRNIDNKLKKQIMNRASF